MSSSTAARTAAACPRGPVGAPRRRPAAAVRRRQRRAERSVSASRSGRKVSQDHCSSGWTSRSAPARRRAGAGTGETRSRPLPQQRDRGRDRARREHDVGVDEDQHVAGGRVRRAAGRRAACPASRRAAVARISRTRRSPPTSARASRRCRRSSRRRGPGSPGRATPPGPAGPAGTAPTRAASSRTGSRTETRSTMGSTFIRGRRTRRRLTAVCAVPATAAGDRRTARPRSSGGQARPDHSTHTYGSATAPIAIPP